MLPLIHSRAAPPIPWLKSYTEHIQKGADVHNVRATLEINGLIRNSIPLQTDT